MEKSATKKESLEVLGMFGAFIILSSLLLLGYQAYFWLKNGYWQKIAVWEIIPSKMEAAILRMEWLGVQKIFLWTFDSDLAFFLFAVGVALIIINALAAEQR